MSKENNHKDSLQTVVVSNLREKHLLEMKWHALKSEAKVKLAKSNILIDIMKKKMNYFQLKESEFEKRRNRRVKQQIAILPDPVVINLSNAGENIQSRAEPEVLSELIETLKKMITVLVMNHRDKLLQESEDELKQETIVLETEPHSPSNLASSRSQSRNSCMSLSSYRLKSDNSSYLLEAVTNEKYLKILVKELFIHDQVTNVDIKEGILVLQTYIENLSKQYSLEEIEEKIELENIHLTIYRIMMMGYPELAKLDLVSKIKACSNDIDNKLWNKLKPKHLALPLLYTIENKSESNSMNNENNTTPRIETSSMALQNFSELKYCRFLRMRTQEKLSELKYM